MNLFIYFGGPSMMQLFVVQHDISWNDPDRSHSRIGALLAGCAALSSPSQGVARLIVLPEMFNLGFSFAHGELAARANAAGVTFLTTLANEYQAWVAGGIPAPSLDEGFNRPLNTLALIGPQGQKIQYAKRHLFGFGGERERYLPGEHLVPATIDGARVGLFICYDLRFPQSMAIAGEQSDLLVIIANWPRARIAHWRALLLARAIENQCFVVGVNRVGEGGGLSYNGNSLLISPRGDILLDAGELETVGSQLIDLDEVGRYRAEFPVLRDRIKRVPSSN